MLYIHIETIDFRSKGGAMFGSRKPRLRTPDGRPERRTPDEMLRDAVSGEDYEHLPGKGKPLDLDNYFSSGEEHRMANKILKDNQVLPQHLQDRKDAESHTQTAADLLRQEENALQDILQEIREAARSVIPCFSSRQDCQQRLNLETWPDFFPDSVGEPIENLRRFLENGERLSQRLAQYNARVKTLIHRYLNHLAKAQESIKSYQKQTLFSRGLQLASSALREINLSEREAEIRNTFPLLPELPPDLPERLKTTFKKRHPSVWKRLF